MKRALSLSLAAVGLVTLLAGCIPPGPPDSGGGQVEGSAQCFPPDEHGVEYCRYQGQLNFDETLIINLDCRDKGGYVLRDPHDGPHVFDEPYWALFGGSYLSKRSPGWSSTASVAWGHIGSRLSTAIKWWITYDWDTYSNGDYLVFLACTSQQDNAWVVAG